MKQIIFTKLGTVKFNDKEYTCEDFFQLVKRNISFDIDKNYIMYDEENNHFRIDDGPDCGWTGAKGNAYRTCGGTREESPIGVCQRGTAHRG